MIDGKEYGCIMVDFHVPEYEWRTLLRSIVMDEDVYDDETNKYGLETKPHTTVLYGIHDWEFDFDDIKKMLPPISEMTAIITGISHFDSEKYDVVKLDVECPRFHEVNGKLRKVLSYTNEFQEYLPHITLAYVKKGLGTKHGKDGLYAPIRPMRYRYSFADGKEECFIK